jgi:hypothetical protein
VHSANCVKTYTVACRRVLSSAHGATRQQQAIAKIFAKLSAYRVPSVIVVFVVLVFKVSFVSLEPISYRGALLSTLLHATVYVFTQFAECTSTDCK